MKILALSDTQLGSGRALADDRLADQEAVLIAIADLAHERDVDVVLHCGDVFETRHPGEEERMVFKRWAAKITRGVAYASGPVRKRRLVVLAGNHDLSNTALASAVDLYDRCEFVRIPTVLDLGGASLACLPWAPIHNLVAGRESAERAGAYAQATEALVAIARDLREQCPAGKPAILAPHWAISGASLPSGLSVDELGEVILPQSVCDLFDMTVAGHIHKTGFFRESDQTPGFYCGSPYPCSFGEENEMHGAWIIDTDQKAVKGDGSFSAWLVEIPSRPLVTIDCDLTSPLVLQTNQEQRFDETDAIVGHIDLASLKDATVRLRYVASEEQHRRVDVPAIRRLLADAGIHRLAQIEPTIIRADRARAIGVDENFTPAAALVAWCDANGIPAGRRERLDAILERYSEAVA